MFRALGFVIVILFLAALLMLYLRKKVLRPYLSRRHMRQLERENAELDEQLRSFQEPPTTNVRSRRTTTRR